MSTEQTPTQFSITIASNVSPFSFHFDTTEAKESFVESRWHSLLGSFGIVHVQGKTISASNKETPTNRQEFLETECCDNPVLEKFKSALMHDMQESTQGEQFSRKSAQRSLLEMARGYYEEVWQALTVDEQLALYHLARDRFIHVGHPGLDPLLRKGLITFSPDLHIMNTSFREFVRIAGTRDNLSSHEAQKGHSIWKVLKVPIGLGLTTIIGVLLFTQEELRTALPAVITLLPFLFQGMPTLTQGKGKPSQ